MQDSTTVYHAGDESEKERNGMKERIVIRQMTEREKSIEIANANRTALLQGVGSEDVGLFLVIFPTVCTHRESSFS